MLRTVAITSLLCFLHQAPHAAPDDARSAIKAIDPANPRSVDAAVKAIDKAVDAKQAAVLPELATLLARTPDKKLVAAQVAAARAIPKLGADPKAAVAALLPVVDRPMPKLTAPKTDDTAAHLAVAGASVNALAELRDPSAIGATLRLMYRAQPLSTQTRRALTAYGPQVVDDIKKLLRGQHADINDLYKREKLDQSCDDTGNCEKNSSREFYAAVLAGDVGDASLVPDLLKLIEAPAVPAYTFDGVPGPTQHAAAFDSLRKLGGAAAAPKLLAIVKNNRAAMEDRTYAASVYAYVATDARDIRLFGTIAADNAADDLLRQATAESFARLSTDKLDINAMQSLAAKYLDAAAKKKEEAKQLDARDKKQAATAAAAYTGYARMFQGHMARIELGTRCKADPGCYAEILWRGRDEAVGRMKRYIADVDQWNDSEKQNLFEAMVDRAMLEVSKRGPIKPDLVDKLLDHAGSDARIVRQAILLALKRAAPRPCPTCVAKLDAVIDQDRGKSTLGDLTIETTIVRNYLRWAK